MKVLVTPHHDRPSRFFLALLLLGLLATIVNPQQVAPSSDAIGQLMLEKLQFRTELAAAVGTGQESPKAAIARLKADKSPSGLSIDSDADFALAAIDVGRRLVSTGKEELSVLFFQEAELSLEAAIKKTPDTSARDKAQYHQKLGLIRSQFLGKAEKAKADLDEAVRLQPDDKHLRQSRDSLANENAVYFKEKAATEGRN